MKTKTILITLVAMLAIAALVFQSCKKEDEKDEKVNKLPTCKITAPVNNQEIVKGETVIISVEASDSDGTITEVSFFVDGVEKSSSSSAPYNYSWTTNNESIGNHTLKATSTDNSGGHTSDEITIKIIEGGGGAGTFTDPRDGQVYNIVDIGDQTWFAENLNYETTSSWWYDNSSANGDIYGRLYTWDAALTACPTGWHLPSNEEWTVLINFLGGENVAGGKMKETETTHWNSPNTGATNSSGFTALPGGSRGSDESFSYLGSRGYLWSGTEGSSTLASRLYLPYDRAQVIWRNDNKTAGFSIRCIKD